MYCECGCGQLTTLAKGSNKKAGRIKGQPLRFIYGHHTRAEKTRKKISKSLIGNTAWNKDLTKETDERVANNALMLKLSGKMSHPHTEETKRQMSESAIERSTEEYRQEWSEKFSGENNPFYGKKHSKESREKLKQAQLGVLEKPFTDKHRENMSVAKTGENNPHWKGGVSQDPYCCIWKDRGYKEEIKERDNYICLNPQCSNKTDRLSIHHIDYDKKNCHPRNLITLCNSCNPKANSNREWYQEFYSLIITKRYYR